MQKESRVDLKIQIEKINSLATDSEDAYEHLKKFFKEFIIFTRKELEDYYSNSSENRNEKNLKNTRLNILNLLENITIYKPDPVKAITSRWLSKDENYDKLQADTSNLIPFLFNLSQNYKRKFKQLENDLKNCVGDLVSLSTPLDSTNGNSLKLKFFVSEDEDTFYWADEVSEGVLYFLAILCIIHQPDPPKLLLLEEPEKGIHPRRIKEVMDFIFQLAEERNIQIILTSHSVHVVDEFAHLPDSVFIFDKDENGATFIKNLQKDIIAPSDKRSAEEGIPAIKYTEPLSEHWIMGFLGGVPQ